MVSFELVEQVNGFAVMDLVDQVFGVPVRVRARLFAVDEGLFHIECAVKMSGPIHDKAC